MPKPLGVAVVGLGYWGPNLLRCLSELPGVEVVAACDAREATHARFSPRHPGLRFLSHHQELLRDPAVEAVALATPASTHHELALQFLRAGKHVLVEKPMATTSAAARSLIEAAEVARRVLMAGHTFEYNPAVVKLREVVRAAAFGRPVYVYTTRVNLGQIREDTNAMWNLAPHDISILLFLLDEMPASVSAMGKSFVRPGQEDVVFLYLEFPSGALAHVHVSWLDPSKVRRVTVVGERQMAVYDDLDPEAKVKVYDKGVDTHVVPHEGGLADYALSLRAGDIVCPRIAWKEPLALECAHFVDCVRTGQTPRSDGRSGYRVTRVLEAAQESLVAQGRRIAVGA
jgi:predicted dehydrogenase